jgi:thymidylate synthase
MYYFEADNSNDMAAKVYPVLDAEGVGANSRNGPVLKFNRQVAMTYRQPWHRGNFTPGRDANPFFHIAESMWMLAGRSDVGFLDYFNSGMKQYSDDGINFNAAYGYRARHHFCINQLEEVAEILYKDYTSRQAVIQLWEPDDLIKETKDKACNMAMVFEIRGIQLELTVFNRSNDLVFGGVTGANPVHFSYFQQWVADKLGVPMGNLTFISTNAHVYTALPHWERMSFEQALPSKALYLPLGELEEANRMCHDILGGDLSEPFESPHMEYIVKPIMAAWIARKEGIGDPRAILADCHCGVMVQACLNWMNERSTHGH